ncbi:DUF1173 family protein [Brucella pituitosa]|uniref:DUF1173 family protein n=1 Tax=Brucella pituitosa TaxID=571256 RepID=UPI0009A23612|nr:DUF1173 family protein [Brucella pituitosa]
MKPNPPAHYRLGKTRTMFDRACCCGPVSADATCLQTIRSAHATNQRAYCLCKLPNPPMYISRSDGRYVIKRMPGTGFLHQVDCLHYQPLRHLDFYTDPAADFKRDADSTINLKLAFALSRRTRPSVLRAKSGRPDQISLRDPVAKGLSLIALLHLMWQSAELHRWHPAFDGKRHWCTVRKRLREAAALKRVKNQPLLDRLYIPETFSLEHKLAILNRQKAFVEQFAAGHRGEHERMVLLAEIKTMNAAHYGYRIWCKHAPQLPVFIDHKSHDQLRKQYASVLALHQSCPHTHLMMIATASITPQQALCIEQSALMLVSQHWLPFERDAEARLLDALVQGGRSFLKNLNPDCQNGLVASLLLTDTRPATALFIADGCADQMLKPAIIESWDQSGYACLTWNPAEQGWPDLPLCERGQRAIDARSLERSGS